MCIFSKFCGVFILMLASVSVHAAVTNVWPFTTPSQYVVSDPTKIEVVDVVAKLKLQATQVYQNTLRDYVTNNTSQSGIGIARICKINGFKEDIILGNNSQA